MDRVEFEENSRQPLIGNHIYFSICHNHKAFGKLRVDLEKRTVQHTHITESSLIEHNLSLAAIMSEAQNTLLPKVLPEWRKLSNNGIITWEKIPKEQIKHTQKEFAFD